MDIAPHAPHRLGLALSGGGYRAAAFHLGTLRKLHAMGILARVDVLSTISGGSITGAAYCLHGQPDYPAFHARMAAALQEKSVIGHVVWSAAILGPALAVLALLAGAGWLLFTPQAPSALPVLAGLAAGLWKYQFVWFPISREIERAYDRFFFHGVALPQLPPRPLLAIGSSNLDTGRPFTFSQTRMGDSAYAYADPAVTFTTAGFPLARAVTASSCVPFAFTPVGIAPAFFDDPARSQQVNPHLVDGGVYDNQGIQKLTQPGSGYECHTIITSDAGEGLGPLGGLPNTAALLLRTVDLFMTRIKHVQMGINLYRNAGRDDRPVAYFSLGWRLDKCIPGFVDNCRNGNVRPTVLAAHGLDPAWVAAAPRAEVIACLEAAVGYASLAARDVTVADWDLARTVPTNLTPLSPAQLQALVRHAENLTELQVRLYCPQLVLPPSPVPQ